VTLVHRGAEFRGQSRFAEEIAGTENIRVLPSRTVTEIHTVDDGVTGVSLSDGSRVEATGVFVRIGVDPRIPEGLSAIRGSDGYVVADVQGRTPVTGVYAAGDVCSRDHQSVSWAIGSAGRAVRAIYNDIAYRLDLDERD
jgi:thioredoxin reductase